MPGCDYPGCRKNSHAYDYYGDVTKKYSFHRIPDTQREVVANLINLAEERRGKANLFICDSHLRPGSLINTNKKRKLRGDMLFSELVIPPGESDAAATEAAAAATSNSAMDTSSFMAGSFSDDSYNMSMSHSQEPLEQEPEQEQEPEEQIPFTATRLSPAKRRKSSLTIRFRRSPKQQPSPNQITQVQSHRTGSELSAKVDEIKLLMSGIANAELKAKENERKYLELDQTLSKTQAQLMSETESKDKEIASLKKQLQQVIAENKMLSESNKSLTVDLNVYRKLIQLESKSSLHPRSPSASPTRKQWRGMRESSTDVDLGDEEQEESLGAGSNGQFKNDSRGSLDEIRKWLKSNKKC